jgi:hypothetical protein
MKLQPPPLDNDISDGYELSFIWRNFFSQLKKWSDFVPTTPLSGDDDTALEARVTALEAQVSINISDISSLQSRVTTLENKAFGGLRKTTAQIIGSLAATYINIVNFQSTAFSTNNGVTTSLANGTFSISTVGNYILEVNLEFSFTSGNKGEYFNVQIYNVTDAVAVANMEYTIHVGGYQDGGTSSASIPFTLGALVNKTLVFRVGNSSGLSGFNINQMSYSITEL